jgi:hypothetical protein
MEGVKHHLARHQGVLRKKSRPKPGKVVPWPPTKAKAQEAAISYRRILNEASVDGPKAQTFG